MGNRFIPDLDSPVIVPGGAARKSEADLAAQFPRVNGAGSVTIGGTNAENNVLTVTFTSKVLPGGAVAVSVTSGASETATSLAAKMAAAIMANAALVAFGVLAIHDAAAPAKVNLKWPGPLSSHVVISGASTGDDSFTIVQLSGGSGPVISSEDIRFVHNGAVIELKANRRMALSAEALKSLVSAAPQTIV